MQSVTSTWGSLAFLPVNPLKILLCPTKGVYWPLARVSCSSITSSHLGYQSHGSSTTVLVFKSLILLHNGPQE